MQYQGLDNDKAKHESNSVRCKNKRNLHQQNPQWWCFLCPIPPFCFAKKIHCIWSGSYSVYFICTNTQTAQMVAFEVLSIYFTKKNKTNLDL